MKVLVGHFTLESNGNILQKTELENFTLAFGDQCIEKMRMGTVFSDSGIEVIPSVLADAASGGLLTKDAFNYIETRILDEVKKHIREIDGMYFYMHGASEVDDPDIGSGEHHILKSIRKLVGPYMPIAIACDPHGNLCKEYVDNTTLIRSFRESPHTDIRETKQFVCEKLADILKNRRIINPVYRKLPLILGGEQSVSNEEPVKSINQYMDELEKDPRIMSCSWHVGYIRHDSHVAGCGIVVVPNSEEDNAYASDVADKLAKYIWDKRHEFHYTGLTAKPDEALKMAVKFHGKPIYITDSGDNVTSGSMGGNTIILRQVLNLLDTKDKRFLFGTIVDPVTLNELSVCKIQDEKTISLGMNNDELDRSVSLDVTIKAKGKIKGSLGFVEIDDPGNFVTVSVKDKPIDIVIADRNTQFTELHQFRATETDCDAYDIIIVKQGYIFPELKKHGKMCVMSLTRGATYQDTSALPFKRIMRPIFPIDNI